MGFDRHPAVDLVRMKILKLLDYWIGLGYSPEKIGDMCGLSTVHVYALMKPPKHPGYKGANLTLNTACKIWTGLGNPLETLLSDCDVDFPKVYEGIDITHILTVSRQVLELDEKIVETVVKRRAVSPKKLAQIESLLASLQKILADVKSVLAAVEEKEEKS